MLSPSAEKSPIPSCDIKPPISAFKPSVSLRQIIVTLHYVHHRLVSTYPEPLPRMILVGHFSIVSKH